MKIIFPKKMTGELAEEIGLHLGDGSMNYYNGKGTLYWADKIFV